MNGVELKWWQQTKTKEDPDSRIKIRTPHTDLELPYLQIDDDSHLFLIKPEQKEIYILTKFLMHACLITHVHVVVLLLGGLTAGLSLEPLIV